MANSSKLPIAKKQVTNRTFEYQKGGVSLNFTLNIEVKTDLKDFVECLKAGVEDVEKVLAEKK